MRGIPQSQIKLHQVVNMLKTINIGSKKVKMKASAATPRLYRDILGKDIFADYEKLLDIENTSGSERWSIFENIAFIMAKQADENIPDDIVKWLDSFDGVPSIADAVGDIFELWTGNLKTSSESKKKVN